MVTYHVVILDAVEFSFKLSDFSVVSIHLITGTGPVLVELVDNQHGVPVHHEVFDAELDSYTKTMETSFVFRGVVGGWEVYPENIS